MKRIFIILASPLLAAIFVLIFAGLKWVEISRFIVKFADENEECSKRARG